MTDYIQLTETSRLAIEYDQDASCPRGDWHMLTGFLKIPNRGDSRRSDVPAVYEDPTGRVADAYEHFQPLPGWGWQDAVARWAKIFHGLHLEWDGDHGGYWFVAGADEATAQTEVDEANRALFYDNWPDLKPGTPEHLAKQAEVITQEQETYRQWAEGEVFGVILERKYGYTRDDDPSIGFEKWESGDSLWGCYLDEEYTPQIVASEYFDLTDDETAALGLS